MSEFEAIICTFLVLLPFVLGGIWLADKLGWIKPTEPY